MPAGQLKTGVHVYLSMRYYSALYGISYECPTEDTVVSTAELKIDVWAHQKMVSGAERKFDA